METILFVDDEPNILNAFKRQLYKNYEIKTANNGKEALEFISSSAYPVPVIVSDLRMPVMDGVQFFTKVKEIAPDSVRILLTGHADLTTAIEAINNGKIFQFLTKPCSQEILVEAIQKGLDHYKTVVFEQNILEQTHQMNFRILIEMLTWANPAAYNRTIRIRRIVTHIVSHINTTNAWQYQTAAMLCQIGCIAIRSSLYEKALSGEILTDQESRIITSHPMIGYRLLENISRIGSIANMVRDQDRPYLSFISNSGGSSGTGLGSQILKIACDYDKFIQIGLTHREIIKFMAKMDHIYYSRLVDALGDDEILSDTWDLMLADTENIEIGMLTHQDIQTKSGEVVIAKDRMIDSFSLEEIKVASQLEGIVEPVRVLVKKDKNEKKELE